MGDRAGSSPVIRIKKDPKGSFFYADNRMRRTCASCVPKADVESLDIPDEPPTEIKKRKVAYNKIYNFIIDVVFFHGLIYNKNVIETHKQTNKNVMEMGAWNDLF